MDQRVSRKPTISDVARQAGISTATVSRTLASPEKVTARTRAIVMEAVRKIGYVPNLAARNLRTSRTRTILAVLPDLGNVFFSRVLRGISDTLVAQGYSLIIADTRNSAAREAQYAEFVLAGRVDGVLLLNGRSILPGRTGVPTVSLCERIPDAPFPHVETENRESARAMTDYLASLGHRSIGYLRGPVTNVLEHERFAGYKDALRAARLKYDPALVTCGDFTLESGEAAAALYLSRPALPDAIFACNDEMAMGLIRGLSAAGVAVPRDVSVAGFDDIEFAEAYNPPITTVRQARREIGEQAAMLLLKLIDGELAAKREIRLTAELVIRKSTVAATR